MGQKRARKKPQRPSTAEDVSMERMDRSTVDKLKEIKNYRFGKISVVSKSRKPTG